MKSRKPKLNLEDKIKVPPRFKSKLGVPKLREIPPFQEDQFVKQTIPEIDRVSVIKDLHKNKYKREKPQWEMDYM